MKRAKFQNSRVGGLICVQTRNDCVLEIDYQVIEEAVYSWFKDVRLKKKNLSISEPILQSNAKEYSETMKIEKSEASSGWLFLFRERYGTTWKQISGAKKLLCQLHINGKEKYLREYLPREYLP